jgi:signal transduction histidine kinase
MSDAPNNLREVLPLGTSHRLERDKETVLSLWLQRVRENIQAARRESHPILIDTLPLLLDQFIEALTPGSTRSVASEGSTACQEHGGERARMTHYSIEEIIQEYQILRDVLLEVLSKSGPVSDAEKVIIWKSIDEVMKQSAISFSLVQSTIREQFFMQLTHDLRNPLSTAKTSAQLILRYADNPDQHLRLASRIAQSIDRADRMITDLLDANRVQAGQRLPLNIDLCDLTLIAQDLIDELGILHGARFILEAAESTPGYWSCDGLRRSLENLISNALKYGDKTTPVRIKTYQGHGRTILAVHNYGNPIPPEEQETLFRAYRRSKAAQASDTQGWGLGLALVRGVAEAHGGSVMLDSATDRGTTFSIDIPTDARPFQDRVPTPFS